MTKTAWPFTENATAPGKRATTVDEWGLLARQMVGDGVFASYLNELEVSADGTDMTTDVATGGAAVSGFAFRSTAIEALTHAAADPANDRIDRVVLRLDFATESIDLAVLTGTPAGSPTAPALTQTFGTTWEISLAQVLINAADSTIDPGDVTDERTLLERNATSNEALHVQDQKAAGTAGGSFTNGAWRTRDLNTAVTNTITGASLATNQVTLPAGTYRIRGSAPAYQVNTHQTRIQNITDGTTLIEGTLGYAAAATDANTVSLVGGAFTLAAQKVIELQHQCETSKATVGLGATGGVAFGTAVYGELLIEKVG